jgi:IS5 family transposase
MTQQDLGLNLSTRRTRKTVFLDEMNLVVLTCPVSLDQ